MARGLEQCWAGRAAWVLMGGGGVLKGRQDPGPGTQCAGGDQLSCRDRRKHWGRMEAERVSSQMLTLDLFVHSLDTPSACQ